MKPKAYSYLRFSTPEQAAGDSHRRQAREAQAYAAEHGLELDDKLTFEDLGVSAFRGRNADTGRLGEFLEAVRAGLVPSGSYLLVESLDRISRQSARKALRVLEDIVEEGITVVTLSDRREYTAEALDTDPMALLMSILVFIRAHEESEMKSRRVRAAWEHKRNQAGDRPLTSVSPAWLELVDGEFVVVEEKAALVRRIFEETLAGAGVEQIVRGLNQDRIPPISGRAKRWHGSYITRVLANPAVIGTFVPHIYTYEDGKKARVPLDPIEGYYPAIIDPEDFERVREMKRQRAWTGGHGHPRRNLFGGLLRCSRCGGSCVVATKGPPGKVKRVVVCGRAKAGAGCQYESTSYDDMEKFFLGRAEEILASAPAGSDELQDLLTEKENQLFGIDEEIDRLVSAIGRTSSRALETKLVELEIERDQIKAELKDLHRQVEAQHGPLVQKRVAELRAELRKPTLDRPRVNALMRQTFIKATVDYDAQELILEWRHGGESRTELSTAAYGFLPGDEGSTRVPAA